VSAPPPPPQVHQAELAPELLCELFSQLESDARILEVRVQERRERLSGPAGRDRLASLRAELVAGTIRGLQIRYVHAGHEWIDTLLRRGPTIRLIRALAAGEAAPLL
jgi:hypothetical protein